MDYLEREYKQVKREINLEDITEFSLNHNVSVTVGDDHQYTCRINRKVYCVSLTFLHALVFGIKKHKSS